MTVAELESGTSEWVVNALVVRAPATAPPKGLAAVIPLVEGVASLFTETVCVCPLCSAGLPQGSASRFSSESLLSRRDLPGEPSALGCAGGAGVSCDEGEPSSVFSDTLAVLICCMAGREGSGRSEECQSAVL